MHICPLPLESPSHLSPLPTPSGFLQSPSWVPCQTANSPWCLFTYVSVYASVLLSPLISPSPSSPRPLSIKACSLCLHLHCCSVSRFICTMLLLLLLLSHFSRVRLCDPIDGSPPGSAVPGILGVRTLEWVAISFSNAWKWKSKVKSLSPVWLLATPWTAAYQAPPSMGFSRQEYWSGMPFVLQPCF